MPIEVTPALIAIAVGWLASSATAAWTLSRRSKQWDEIEDVIFVVFGDRKTATKGLQQKYLDLLDDMVEDRAKIRGLLRALDANAADEQSVEDAVRAKIKAITAQHLAMIPTPAFGMPGAGSGGSSGGAPGGAPSGSVNGVGK